MISGLSQIVHFKGILREIDDRRLLCLDMSKFRVAKVLSIVKLCSAAVLHPLFLYGLAIFLIFVCIFRSARTSVGPGANQRLLSHVHV